MSQTDKLSEQQKDILASILALYERIEASGNDFAARQLEIWGVPWRTKWLYCDLTRSDHAAISRALSRLERRGLVIRQNSCTGTPGLPEVYNRSIGGMMPRDCRLSPEEPAPKRSDHVMLTLTGRQIAEVVNKNKTENVNHLQHL